MKPLVIFTALLVCISSGVGGDPTAVQGAMTNDRAVGMAEGFLVDPCTLEVVDCASELSIEQKIRLASREAGVDEEIAVRIAFAESSFRCIATNENTNGSNDKGLFQINSIHKVPDYCRLDCECNLYWAISEMKRHGFGAWGASKSNWM